MSYKISVIIPIYNAEKNLEHTIQSIIQQSIGFENIELILVDDNSTDNSKSIIEKYVNKYKNIIPYYSKKNHGSPGFGRNIGIKKASASYVMFIDNDDEYDSLMCETLYNEIINENADIVCCNAQNTDSISNDNQYIAYENCIELEDKIIISEDDILFFSSITIWNKIFKKEIIQKNKIRFLEDTRADDFSFCIEYYLKSKKLIFLKNFTGYYWNITSESLSHVVSEKHIDELLYTYRYIYNKLIEANKGEYMNKIIKNHIGYLILQCTYLDENKNKIKEILSKIKNFEDEIGFNLQLNTIWEETLNRLILSQHFQICIFLMNIIHNLRNIAALRKINRKL